MPFHWHFGISSEIATAKTLWSHRAGPLATAALPSTHSYSCSERDQPAHSVGSLAALAVVLPPALPWVKHSCCSNTQGPEYQMRCPGSHLQPSAAPVTKSAPSQQHLITVNVWVSFPSGSWAQGILFQCWFTVTYVVKRYCFVSIILLLFPV